MAGGGVGGTGKGRTITEPPFTNLSLFAPCLSFLIPPPLRNNRDLWYFNISLILRF